MKQAFLFFYAVASEAVIGEGLAGMNTSRTDVRQQLGPPVENRLTLIG